jgi:predicted transcriptional regulator
MENILRFITPKADTSFLEEDMTIRQALEKMDYYKFSVIPLVDKNGIYKGTVSEGDLLRFIKNDENFNLKTAENVRLFCVPRYRPYSNLSINSKLNEIIKLALDQNFIPLTDDRGMFIGIIKRKTILTYLYDENFTFDSKSIKK